MSDDAWIQQSLSRLEALEAQKEALEGNGEEVPEDLGAEISALYETLESHAASVGEPPPQVSASVDNLGSPLEAVQMPAYGSSTVAPIDTLGATESYVDAELPRQGRGALVAGLIAVAVLVAGGAYYVTNMTDTAPAAVAPETLTPVVIDASAIPDDTQEPKAAVGIDADVTPEQEFNEAKGRRPSGSAPHRSRPTSGKKPAKDSGRKIQVDDSRDPLSGL